MGGRHLAVNGKQEEECHTRTQYSSFQSLFSLCPVACIHAATYVVGENGGQANTHHKQSHQTLLKTGRQRKFNGKVVGFLS